MGNDPRLRPQILDKFITFSQWGVGNQYNGIDWHLFSFYDAEFVKDFAAWRAGDKPYTLCFDPAHGTLSEVDQDEMIVKKCQLYIWDKEA